MTRGMIRFVSYRNLSQKRLLSEQQGRLWSLSDWTWHFVMPYLSKQRVARWYSWYGLLITSFQYMSHCIFHIFWRNLVLATLANNKEHSCVVHLLIREAPFLKCVVSIYGHCPNSNAHMETTHFRKGLPLVWHLTGGLRRKTWQEQPTDNLEGGFRPGWHLLPFLQRYIPCYWIWSVSFSHALLLVWFWNLDLARLTSWRVATFCQVSSRKWLIQRIRAPPVLT